MALTGEAKREYQRRWLAERRNKAIDMLGGQCNQCGSDSDLEFDHIDRSTKDNYLKSKHISGGSFFSRSWSWIEEELKKCQLLCKGCHHNKTASEKYCFPPWKYYVQAWLQVRDLQNFKTNTERQAFKITWKYQPTDGDGRSLENCWGESP